MSSNLDSMLGLTEEKRQTVPRGETRRSIVEWVEKRYAPAYRAARNLLACGILVFVASVVLAIGLLVKDSDFAWFSFAISSVGALVAFLFSMISSFIRAFVDKAVYLTPGLSNQEKLNIAFKATDGRAPWLGEE